MAESLILRGLRVATPQGIGPAAVHIEKGRIAAIVGFDDLPREAVPIEAGKSLVMAGLVDTHVHINEPGRTEWEGFASATRAAAAGGITSLVDMPLNSIPATTDVAALETKRAAAEGSLAVDVGFWGGVVPGNAAALRPLIEAGVLGFKAFLVPSGVEEFPHVGPAELRTALAILGESGVPLLVHAELPGPIERAEAALAGSPQNYQTFLASRPRRAEVEAIALLADLCRETGAPVHIVHLSSADALEILAAAKDEGLPMSAETCPHYLHLSAEAIAAGATEFKCAPPIREAENRERLWEGLAMGTIDMIVSDHSPCTAALKQPTTGDFLAAWGGIASLQLTLPLVWTEMRARGLDVAELLRWMSSRPGGARGPLLQGQPPSRCRRRPLRLGPGGELSRRRPGAPPQKSRHPLRWRAPLGRRPPNLSPRPLRLSRRRGCRAALGGFPLARFMSAPLSPPAGSLLDLAAERLGATVVAASDEFFAAAENLLRASEPVFIADKYVSTGKWMDGWESRRRRTPGDDWCLIRLGLRGRIQRVVVDTRHFVGNFPEAASLEVCDVAGTPDRRALDDEKTPWREVLSRSPLRGDHPNEFFLEEPALATHLRLRIYPDGGVARLRAFGEVAPDWEWLDTSGGLVDLAGVASGGRVLDQSDMFFGSAMNMLMPYPPRDMSDGWETRRRRDAGHDWAVVALGAAGRISEIEIDTTHFRGNAPGRCRIDGGDVSPGGGAPSSWRPLLPEAPLQPHSRHVFREALLCPGAVAFLRVHIYPDGGLARLRARGRTARSEGLLIALGASQAEPLEARRQTLAACCASTAWVEGMLARDPTPTSRRCS